MEKNWENLKDVPVFINIPLKVYELLTRSESPDISIALIQLNGENRKVRNRTTAARYYVIGGMGGIFRIWNQEGDVTEREVKTGDYVSIPPLSPYQDTGNLIMISINQPAFSPDDVDILS